MLLQQKLLVPIVIVCSSLPAGSLLLKLLKLLLLGGEFLVVARFFFEEAANGASRNGQLRGGRHDGYIRVLELLGVEAICFFVVSIWVEGDWERAHSGIEVPVGRWRG